MDGLIKGLLDVAIGHEGGNESQDERSRSSSAQAVSGDQEHQRDERSRSSWAQVVSGDQDHEKQVQSQWQGSGSRPSGRTHKTEYGGYEKNEGDERRHGYNQNKWNRKEQEEENNDGWETVGKKPRRRPQKVMDPSSGKSREMLRKINDCLNPHKAGSLVHWEIPFCQLWHVNMDHWQGYKRPPSEQEYSDEVGTGTSIEPSEEELADFLQACNRLWQLDLNRLEPGKDYQIDCGEGKKVFQKEDMAEGSLFCYVDEDIFRTKPTFARFCSLLDNYNPNAGCKEVVTSEEKQEQAAFIEEISRTAPIQYLHKVYYATTSYGR
ncbi:hypothetical protein GOBAR_DD29456 [Gossypium barbadense]|nr:hypothetical protein GOBAR_DD29456 [Gossypium barbadense]